MGESTQSGHEKGCDPEALKANHGTVCDSVI